MTSEGSAPDLYDETADPSVWSNMALGRRRLTWQEAYEAERERNRRLSALATILSDLDRCQHGRHEGDVCGGVSGCNGPSRGNPHMQTGDIIGFTLSAEPIVFPRREDRHDPDAWHPGT